MAAFRYSAVTPNRPEATCLIGELALSPLARGVEALLALAALAAVGLGADPVHGDGQRLVRLGRERAQRHAGRDEALPDLGDALDLVERHRRQLAVEVEQVADRDRVLARRSISV